MLSRVCLALCVAALLAASPSGALSAQAAPSAQEAITFTFPQATYFSILGGSVTGNATLAGSIDASRTQLSSLRGSINLPLRDEKIEASPTGPVVASTSSVPVFWNLFECTPLGCTQQSGTSTFSVSSNTVPVELRFGSLRGTGTLAWSTSVCTAACPPPGASYFLPSNSNLFGGVVGNKDGGNLSMFGPSPTIG